MASSLSAIISEEFEIIEEKSGHDRVEYTLGLPKRRSLEEALERVYGNLVQAGFYPLLRRGDRGLVLYVFKVGDRRERVLLIIGLALATLATVTISSLAFEDIEGSENLLSWSLIAYPIGLLVPLLLHELGHALAMKLKRVPASPPYLIPAPPLQLGFLGTFGAIINMRWLPATIRDLAFIALAGPTVGFIAALPLAYIGLSQSIAVEASELTEGFEIPVLPMIFVILLSTVDVPEGSALVLSPMAFATMIVFLVTFLNLIPVGMLDGGHVVRVLLGERLHKYLSLAVIGVIVIAALFVPIFAIYSALLIVIYLLSRGRHPGAAYSLEIKSHFFRVLIATVYAFLLALTIPIPVA